MFSKKQPAARRASFGWTRRVEVAAVKVIEKLKHIFYGKRSFSTAVRRLILFTAIPLVTCIVILLIFFINTNRQYNNILTNLSIAGGFNEDFQTTLDFKMYQVVINREMYEQLRPMDDIEHAQTIVDRLHDSTTDAESIKRLSDIERYLEFLTNNIDSIVEDQGYEQNMRILDRRIRVLTMLVHEKMQEYIYNETQLMTDMRDSSNRSFIVFIITFSTLSLAIIVTVITVGLHTTSKLTKPLKELSDNFKTVGEGDFSIHTIDVTSVEIGVLHDAFERMVGEIEELMEHIRQEKDNLRLIEFQLLQSQINPHFLYNTFDTIIWLTEDGEYEKVKKMMVSLSNFCRIALSGGKDIITIEEELRHARSYLEIQQVRYFDVLRYEIDVSENVMDCPIPKLSLQPIIENALYHGIKNKRSGGIIRINCAVEGESAAITIYDTGVGLTKERLAQVRASIDANELKPGYGLGNVYERLRLYYREHVTFEITSEHLKYTQVKFTIPLRSRFEYE